jgi:hypothetical protein
VSEKGTAHQAKGSEVSMQISFPREQQLTFDSSGVDFPAIVDGRRVPCKISREALDDHFKAEAEGPLHAFLRHRSEIAAKARQLIERQISQPDGSILINTFDIGPRQGQYRPV